MKKHALKMFSMISFVVMAFSTNVFAADVNSDHGNFFDEVSNYEESGIVIKTTKEERDQQFNRAMQQIMSKIEEDESGTKGPKYHYKTEYLSYKYKTVGGYAGNQNAGGYRFQTGGGFWYSDSGGPSVSGSISLSFPAPFNVIQFSVSLGNKSSSGQFVTVPNTTDYFKLYVSKKMEIRPYAVYRAKSGTQNWELYSVGGVPVTYSVNAYAKKV